MEKLFSSALQTDPISNNGSRSDVRTERGSVSGALFSVPKIKEIDGVL
jgi:hypothetical protein